MKLLRVREAADRLNSCERTVWNYVRSGKLHGFKVGRRWMIPEESLEKFLAAARKGSLTA